MLTLGVRPTERRSPTVQRPYPLRRNPSRIGRGSGRGNRRDVRTDPAPAPVAHGEFPPATDLEPPIRRIPVLPSPPDRSGGLCLWIRPARGLRARGSCAA